RLLRGAFRTRLRIRVRRAGHDARRPERRPAHPVRDRRGRRRPGVPPLPEGAVPELPSGRLVLGGPVRARDDGDPRVDGRLLRQGEEPGQALKKRHGRPVSPLLTTDGFVRDRKGRVLLVQRRNPPYRNEWAFPGGFVDEGEDPEDACVREVKEE